MGFSSLIRIPEPDLDFLPVPVPKFPDPEVKKAPDPGSRIPDPGPQHWKVLLYTKKLEQEPSL
jgi:hypothetical protein